MLVLVAAPLAFVLGQGEGGLGAICRVFRGLAVALTIVLTIAFRVHSGLVFNRLD